jgi:tetratricopeptide (TPR) repeat protein
MPGPAQVTDFGHYELQRLLGHGGMGEVYLARDGSLGREVALKFVAADRLAEPGARQRLLREAQAAAALDHPCICTVYEAGEAPDGRAYIAMQYVEGETLAERLQRGPLPVREALTLASHIADALAAAHRRGIVHRDLKPGNIIIAPSGRPKLLDFGLAKFAPKQLGDDAATLTGLTQIGTIIGTPPYMAPEQVQQRPIDGRTDLFSLGAVLVECLTGKRVFEGPTAYETIANVLRLDPPPVSTLRAELTEQHDELCARLLEKEPAERFQSAEEVYGALRVLTPDPSRTHTVPHPILPSPSTRWRAALVTGLVVAAAALGGSWYWTRPPRLPLAPPDARQWYDRGVEAIREGAYHSGRRALEEATNRFPQYALAYARLAEADTELDDEGSALKRFARLSQVVPDESQLPDDERLRVRAVRALVLRDMDVAMAALGELAMRHPEDAAAWVDLGRAQESAGLRGDAAHSFRKAIAQNSQYPVAHLRLGIIEGMANHMDRALAAFSEAERLYDLASNIEGRTEVRLERGEARYATGAVREARQDFETALGGATDVSAPAQQVRARLGLAGVTAAEGRLGDAERLAADAVRDATSARLETIAADGLIDLAATLTERDRLAEAAVQVHRALELATERHARRTTARGRLQLAEVLRLQHHSQEALAIVQDVLPFVRRNRYQRFELFGLLIAARAQEQLGNLEQAQEMGTSVLRVAESLKDDSRVALAASDLAARETTMGHYTEALSLREKAETIYRRQGDESALPYTLANRADLLVRLGRADDARKVLDELDAGIASGKDAYIGRARRSVFLRALAAATTLRCADALNLLRGVTVEGDGTDSTSLLVPGVAAFCRARLGRLAQPVAVVRNDSDPIVVAERSYWLAAAALTRGDMPAARAWASDALALLSVANDELRWRLNAIHDASQPHASVPSASTLGVGNVRESFEQVRARFGSAFATYQSRPDLVDLRKRAGLP